MRCVSVSCDHVLSVRGFFPTFSTSGSACDHLFIAAEPQRGSTLFLTCSLDPVFCAELCIVEKSIRVGWMLDVHFPGEKVEFQVIF